MALYIECCYAECRNYLNVMWSVGMLNVVKLSVMAPFKSTANKYFYKYFETLGHGGILSCPGFLYVYVSVSENCVYVFQTSA